MAESTDEGASSVRQSWVYLGAFIAVAVLFAASALWGFGIASAASVATGSMIAVALTCRPNWHQNWFRRTFAALTLIHIVAVISFPWSDAQRPGFHTIPFVFADLFACLAVVWLVERLVQRLR